MTAPSGSSAVAAKARAGDIGDDVRDHFEGDELDRLVAAGAVAVGLLVLDVVRLLECRERRPIHRTRRHRHLQFERLALIMQCGGAFERDLIVGKTVCGEPRPGVSFKLAEDRIDLRPVDRTDQYLSDLVK
jgi:hypothetical protein